MGDLICKVNYCVWCCDNRIGEIGINDVTQSTSVNQSLEQAMNSTFKPYFKGNSCKNFLYLNFSGFLSKVILILYTFIFPYSVTLSTVIDNITN